MKSYPFLDIEPLENLQEFINLCTTTYSGKDAFRIRINEKQYKSVSYSQFASDIRALGNGVISKGLSGNRYAILGENMYEWLLAYFAGVNSNTTVVPLDKELPVDELIELIVRSEVKTLFYSNTYIDAIIEIQKNLAYEITYINLNDHTDVETHLELHKIMEHGYELIQNGQDSFSNIKIDAEKPCAILFTSGTTGKSKGVMLSHKNIASNIVAGGQAFYFDENDVLLSVLPVHHSFESTCGIMTTLNRGATICINDSAKNLLSNMKLFKPNLIFFVPLYIETLLKKIHITAQRTGKAKKLKAAIKITNALKIIGIDIKRKVLKDVHDTFGGNLKRLVTGGAYAHPSLIKGFRDLGINVYQGYGITECSPLVAVNRMKHYNDNAAGLIVPCNEVKIKVQDGSTTGEVLVRGSNVMMGYFNDPESTKTAFEGEWFNTGDIGYMDDEGFLYITGRSKNIIVLKNGKNISPEAVEGYFAPYDIIEQIVVTEGKKDDGGIDTLYALIYPNPELSSVLSVDELDQTLNDILTEVNSKLASYIFISDFKIRSDPFPQTASKKIIRSRIN